MKKKVAYNGITIEKNIELVISNTGSIPWYYYLLQGIVLVVLSMSIFMCFTTGTNISTNSVLVLGCILLFVIYYMAVFLFSKHKGYLLLGTALIYIATIYIFKDSFQEGYVHVANSVIGYYNRYFGANITEYMTKYIDATTEVTIFFLFLLFTAMGAITYTVVTGRWIVVYLIYSLPFVFLPFIVGLVPGKIPYLLYVGGTFATFASTVSEKHGLLSKTNTKEQNRSIRHRLDIGRVKVQVLIYAIMVLVIGLSHFTYSPEKYQREFQAEEIKASIQSKMKSIVSGELLKDSNMSNFFTGKHSNSGLSNGVLGRTDSLRYNNKVALKVTTQRYNEVGPSYIKGYVGEQYEGNQWTSLGKAEEEELKELQNVLLTQSNVENLPSGLFYSLRDSAYNIYPYVVRSMKVENISADNTVDYVPYGLADSIEMEKGKITSYAENMVYYSFSIDQFAQNSDALNIAYKNLKINTILQLNFINDMIVRRWLGIEEKNAANYLINPEGLSIVQKEILDSSIEQLKENDLFSIDFYSLFQDSLYQDQYVSFGVVDGTITLELLINSINNFNTYSIDENRYYNYVVDTYTKLPEDTVRAVEELVAGHEVNVDRENTQGNLYTYINGIDMTDELEYFYSGYEKTEFDSEESYIQDKYYEAILFVQEYLANNTTYTLSPGKTPAGKDFVEYFLFENKKGYCMHYASAAAIMLRAMGVPTRYVEGYVITPKDIDSGSYIESTELSTYGSPYGDQSIASDVITMEIKDTNAHAWVEVYLPGLGWMPIEVTAPYSSNDIIQVPPVNEDSSITGAPTQTVQTTATPSARPTRKPSASPVSSASVKPSASPTNASVGGVGQGEGSDKGIVSSIANWYGGLNPIIHRCIRILIGCIMLILLVITIIGTRRRIVLKRHMSKKSQASINEKVLLNYYVINTLYRSKGISHISTAPHEQFVQQISQAFPFASVTQIEHYVRILLKAKFIEKPITEEEYVATEKFQTELLNQLMAQSSRWSRWYYKYILLLI